MNAAVQKTYNSFLQDNFTISTLSPLDIIRDAYLVVGDVVMDAIVLASAFTS